VTPLVPPSRVIHPSDATDNDDDVTNVELRVVTSLHWLRLQTLRSSTASRAGRTSATETSSCDARSKPGRRWRRSSGFWTVTGRRWPRVKWSTSIGHWWWSVSLHAIGISLPLVVRPTCLSVAINNTHPLLLLFTPVLLDWISTFAEHEIMFQFPFFRWLVCPREFMWIKVISAHALWAK